MSRSSGAKGAIVERFGSIGAFLAAAACPACFPMLATVGAAFGLGIFRPFERWVFLAFQLLLIIAMLGTIVSFAHHRRSLPMIAGIAGPLLIFFALYLHFNELILNIGLFIFVLGSVFNFIATRKCARC